MPVIVTVDGLALRDGGILADVAPTVLEMLGDRAARGDDGPLADRTAGSAVAADDADALYGLPLDAFVAERDALAKRLRTDGRGGDADEVKALRKPSVAAWAVNQVVRSQPNQRRRCGRPATR